MHNMKVGFVYLAGFEVINVDRHQIGIGKWKR